MSIQTQQLQGNIGSLQRGSAVVYLSYVILVSQSNKDLLVFLSFSRIQIVTHQDICMLAIGAYNDSFCKRLQFGLAIVPGNLSESGNMLYIERLRIVPMKQPLLMP